MSGDVLLTVGKLSAPFGMGCPPDLENHDNALAKGWVQSFRQQSVLVFFH